jgi:hypothetical protein
MDRVTKHGHSRNGRISKLLRTWWAIKSRCGDPDNPNYGGRGIAVCQRWRDSFEAFAEDMGEPPSPGHSIERLDVDGPYSPENCIWADWFVQQNNTRKNIRFEFEGRIQTLSQWVREFGVSYQTVYQKIRKGWGFEDAVDYAIHRKNIEPSQN